MGAPYIYDISRLRINKDASFELRGAFNMKEKIFFMKKLRFFSGNKVLVGSVTAYV